MPGAERLGKSRGPSCLHPLSLGSRSSSRMASKASLDGSGPNHFLWRPHAWLWGFAAHTTAGWGAGVHLTGEEGPQSSPGLTSSSVQRTSPPEVETCFCSSLDEERGDPTRTPALSTVSHQAFPRGVRYCSMGPPHKGRGQHLAEGTVSWSLSAARFPSDLGIIPSSPWAWPLTAANQVNADALREPPWPRCSHVGLLSGAPPGGQGEGGSEASHLWSLSAAPHVPPQPGQPLWALGTGAQERDLVSQTPSRWGVTSRSGGCKIPRSQAGLWRGRGGGLRLGIPLPGVFDTCFRRSRRGLPLMLFITFKSSCRLQSFLKLKISLRSWARVPEAS